MTIYNSEYIQEPTLAENLENSVSKLQERYPQIQAAVMVEEVDSTGENTVTAGNTENLIFLGSLGKPLLLVSAIETFNKIPELETTFEQYAGYSVNHVIEQALGASTNEEIAILITFLHSQGIEIRNMTQASANRVLEHSGFERPSYVVNGSRTEEEFPKHQKRYNVARLSEVHELMKILSIDLNEEHWRERYLLEDKRAEDFMRRLWLVRKAMSQVANKNIELQEKLLERGIERHVIGKSGWYGNYPLDELKDLEGLRHLYEWDEEISHASFFSSSEIIYPIEDHQKRTLVTWSAAIPHTTKHPDTDTLMRNVSDGLLDPVVKELK